MDEFTKKIQESFARHNAEAASSETTESADVSEASEAEDTGTSARIAGAAADNGDTEGQIFNETPEQQVRRLKAVIDGQELEVSEEEAIAAYQKVKGADKRFQEAAQLRKQAEAEKLQLIERLKSDPAGVLSELGYDVDAFAEQRVVDRYQEELLSPEEKEKVRIQKERDQYKAELEKRQQTEQQAAYAKQVEQSALDWSDKIDRAIKGSNIPKTPYMAKRVVDVLIAAKDHGHDITPEQSTEIVYKGFQRELQAISDVLESDHLVEFLGKKSVDKIRKHLLGKVKNPTPKGRATGTASAKGPNSKKNVPTLDEIFRAARGF